MKNNNSIDISLLFFSFAFAIVIFGLFSKLLFPNKQLNENKLTTSVVQTSNNKTIQKIDYNQPILCNFQTMDSTISAAIQANSISIFFKNKDITQKYIVEGDCLYSWNSNETKGQKKCGIGSSITMGKQLLSSGMISLDSLPDMIPESQRKGIDIQAMIKSCTNAIKINGEVFVVPKSVRFD